MYNFSENEVVAPIRTKWIDTHNHKTTANCGDLFVCYWKEILPKDELKLSVSSLVKMTTPNFQTMDVAFIDIHFYYIPRRQVWEHWKQFQGERNVGPHETQPQYTIPQTTAPEGGWGEGTLADYFGIPTKVPNLSVDSCYFRSYALVVNEYYRDQQRQDFCDISVGDETTAGSNGNNYVTDIIKGGKPFKAAKLSDYFTRSLLTPQSGDPVTLPLGITAPVINGIGQERFRPNIYGWGDTKLEGSHLLTSYDGQLTYVNEDTSQGAQTAAFFDLQVDLTKATAATVNQLRMAFALQKIYERNNRGGNRYVEQLVNRWNVTPSDLSLQRPEFLGGARIPLNVEMVVQTSSTDSTSPLGQIAGFSNTFDSRQYFSKGFEEHGIVLGLAVVRHQRTYQQGLSKFFTRKTPEDFYITELQSIGEVGIKNYEIYATGTDIDNDIFGYQEYAAEYRQTPNRVSGQFRSNATNSFDNWHYADDYDSTPVNGEEWIMENDTSVNRTLTVKSDVANQFYFDFSFKEEIIRSMPPHSIPGFIDHH